MLQSYTRSLGLKEFLLQNKKFQKVDAAKVIHILPKKKKKIQDHILIFSSLPLFLLSFSSFPPFWIIILMGFMLDLKGEKMQLFEKNV